jgi:histidyl-tRNA synthetase
VEIYGVSGPEAEAEVLTLGHTLLRQLGVRDVRLHINSIGCKNCRARYQEKLKAFLGENFNGLCLTCRERFGRNALRVLDCKVESCRKLLENAPSVLDSLDGECRAHFDKLQETLERLGIPFHVNPKIVRGLDYYARTVFEFINDDIPTIIGGGRYDGLIEEVGGAPTAGVGFGMGLERLAILLEKQTENEADTPGPVLFIGNSGAAGHKKAQELTYALRTAGIPTEYDLLARSVKAQMKYANKINARYTMIIGDDEIAHGEAAVKNMATGESAVKKLYDPQALAEFITGKNILLLHR